MARVLLVGVDGDTARALAAGAERVASLSEVEARLATDAPDLDAVVIGASVDAPIQVAQRISTADPDVGVLVLCDDTGCDEFRKALQMAPLLGDEVRCVAVTAREALAGELAGIALRARARRAHQRTIAALNKRIAEADPEAPRTRAGEYVGQLLDHAPIGIVALDARGRVVAWNARADQIFGRSERRMLGTPLDALFEPHERTRWEAFSSPAPLRRAPQRETFRMGGAAGPLDVEILLAGVSARAGSADTLVLLTDVTAREQARRDREAALAHVEFLAEASRLLAASLDLAPTLDIVARLAVPRLGDWCFVDLAEEGGWIDRVAVAHADPSGGELASRMRRRLPPPERGPKLGVAAALARGEPQVVEEVTDELFVQIARDADHLAQIRELAPLSFLGTPMIARGRLIGVLSFVSTASPRAYGPLDLTLARELADRAAVAVDNARNYAAAQEARLQAEEASRVKDEFLAVVSHELRTPLTAILGWARTLVRRPSLPEPLARGLAVIERNAVAQARIVEDILDTSRIVTGKLRLDLRTVDLVDTARLALDALGATATTRDVSVELVAPAPVLVLGDADRLQQVLCNLLGNALKFTPAGGRVEIRVVAHEREARVVVRDTGAGIRPELLPFVFDRFRQGDGSTTRAHGGLGLGLAIVRHLVELHGGSARAESEGPELGATFTVTLPLVRDPRETLAATDAMPLRLDGTQVLVVEDDLDTRELLAMALRDRGAEITAVDSAAGAIAALARAVPDVLVSDLAMPDEDGLALLRLVRASAGAAARVPAIALSAYAGPSHQSQALGAGFQTHLAKPVDIDALTTAIAALAARGAGDRRR